MIKRLLFLLFILMTYTSFSQNPFQWPNDLKIDPNNYDFKELGVTKIIQIKEYKSSNKSTDSTSNNFEYLNYIIEYDSNYRISSFKYDFQNHLGYHNYFGDSTKLDSLKKVAQKFELPIYFIKLNDKWVAQNYWEALFSYDEYGYNKIEVFNPFRIGFRGVLDGVYIKETQLQEIKTIKRFNEFGEMIQLSSYSEGKLIHQETYKYFSYTENNKTVRLLQVVAINNITYKLSYYFE